MIRHEQVTEKYKPYYAIRCFSCDRKLSGKSALGQHRGHDVQYVKADGTIDDD